MSNTLAKKMIQEILDSDKNINKRLTKIQLKNVPKNEIEAMRSESNSEELQKLTVFVVSFRKLLEYKNHIAKLKSMNTVRDDKMNYHLVDLLSIEQVHAMYNFIVNIYRKRGNTQQTRNNMKTIIMSLENYINSIVNNLKLLEGKFIGSSHLALFLNTLSIYELIQDQLKNENFSEITQNDISQYSAKAMQKFNSDSPPLPVQISTTIDFDD